MNRREQASDDVASGGAADAGGTLRAPYYALLLTDKSGVIDLAEGIALPPLIAAPDTLIGKNVKEIFTDLRSNELVTNALVGRPGRMTREIENRAVELWFGPRRSTGTTSVEGIVMMALPGAARRRNGASDDTSNGHDGSGPLKIYTRGIRLLLSQAPGAFWTTDAQLRLTALMGRGEKIRGTTPGEWLGKTVQEFIGTDDPTNAATARHLAALQGTSSSFRYALHDNLYEIRVEPLRDDRDQIVGAVGIALNITDHQRAEDELSLSRAQLSEAQRLAHVGSWSWDVGSNALVCSDELQRIYGGPTALQGTFEDFMGRVHPEDVARVRAAIGTALQDRKPFAYCNRIRRGDNQVRVLETRGDVVTDANRMVVRLTGSCWDVTEQSKANAELAGTASLLRATLEATADGILVVDREGNIAIKNQRFLSLWALPESAAIDDSSLLDLAAGQLEDPTRFIQRVHELYSSPEAQSFDVLRFKDGRVFERTSIPQQIGSEVVGRVWSFRNVTDRERLLRRAEFLADAGRLLASLDVEKALEGVARLSVPYLGDGCAVDLLTDVGGARRLLVIERDLGGTIRTDLPRAVLAGRPLIYSLDSASYMSVPLPGRNTMFGVLTFVATPGRRYGEADLELAEELARRTSLAIENAQLYRNAEDALHVREEFLSIAAHEIRGPITSLHLSIQALRRASPTSRMMGKLLDVIERDDRQLIRLVDELLDVTRIRGGHLHFDLERVDLAEVTREVTVRLGPDLARSGSSLTVSSSGDVVGFWDRTRLDQVVTNLISNAIKYGLGKPIDVSATSEGERAELVVRDHGIGVDASLHQQIFDPFARAVSGRNYGGLGLGLYIVRTIVDGLGGTVSVQSTPQGGSAFTVSLPKTRQA